MRIPYFLEKKTDFTIGFADPMFPIQCTTYLELWLHAEMGGFYKKTHFAMKNSKFWKAGVGVKNFWMKLPKGTPLRQIGSNKSFGVCGSSRV